MVSDRLLSGHFDIDMRLIVAISEFVNDASNYEMPDGKIPHSHDQTTRKAGFFIDWWL
jgi:hypothetical protein